MHTLTAIKSLLLCTVMSAFIGYPFSSAQYGCRMKQTTMSSSVAFAGRETLRRLKAATEDCPGYYDSALQLKIYTVPSTPAEYPGGVMAMMKQTRSISLTQQELMSSNSKVSLNLYINAEGKIIAARNPKRKEGEYSPLEKKVIDQLKPIKWKPAMCGQKEVACIYLCIIRFHFE